MTRSFLAGNLDGLDLGLLDLLLGHGDGEHAVLHGGLDLLRLGVLRQPEPAQELAAAAFHPVPPVVLLLLLLLRSPLIWSTLPSSTSTFTSSFFSPGTSALNTWALGVSFQSMRAPANAAASESEEMRGKRLPLPEPKGKPWKGSQRSREKGSNTLLRRISDIVVE